jgi:hypothetical protein
MSNNSACLQDDNRYRVTPFNFFLASFVSLIVEQI